MNNTGWIKIHKSLLEWEWYHDNNVFRVFTHLLLRVNYEDKKWQGIEIKRGSIITSLGNFSGELNISVKQLRTALKKLKTTGEVAIKTTNKYTHIQIVNYELYQVRANKGQTKGKQRATTKEYKEIKEDIIYPAFSDFWELYDKKQDKPRCQKKWEKLSQSTKEKIINYIPNYIKSQPNKKYRKNPLTFLNNESWENELINNKGNERQSKISELSKLIRSTNSNV